jgi:hypothetical protein
MSKQDLPEVRENPDVHVDPPPDPPGHVDGGVGYKEHQQIPPVTPDPPLSAQFDDQTMPDEIQEGEDTNGGRDSEASEPTG